MARPGLLDHRKFLRLAYTLKLPPPYALGLLEAMWLRAYQNGDALLGDRVGVELAAMWPGDPGVFAEAVIKAGFIDEDEGTGDCTVHDLDHHAPAYVVIRRTREQERRRNKDCAFCAREYHSSDSRSTYCSHSCRQAAYRLRGADGVTDPVTSSKGSVTPQTSENKDCVTDGVTDRYGSRDGVTDRDTTPAPSSQLPARREEDRTITTAVDPRGSVEGAEPAQRAPQAAPGLGASEPATAEDNGHRRKPKKPPPDVLIYPPRLLEAIPDLPERWRARMAHLTSGRVKVSAQNSQLVRLAELLDVAGAEAICGALRDAGDAAWQTLPWERLARNGSDGRHSTRVNSPANLQAGLHPETRRRMEEEDRLLFGDPSARGS